MSLSYPGGARFAFTIIDDTDVATVENVKPVYDLLESQGILTTKTVWPFDCPEGSPHYSHSQTLENQEYLEFVLGLRDAGFEIASHGATMESSTRARTLAGLNRFRELFGRDPKVYVNHAVNRENLYWGEERIDNRALRFVYRALARGHPTEFDGHDQESDFYWGDLCRERVEYVRNLTFSGLNVLDANPSMPYRDPRRPDVRWWFSTNDADDWRHFVKLLSPDNLDRLEREGGVCIVTTHCGKGFTDGGGVLRPSVRAVLEDLGSRPGWFVPAGQLLDWLRDRREGEGVPPNEWRAMQRRWLRDLVAKHFRTLVEGSQWW